MGDNHDTDQELIKEIKYYTGALPPEEHARILKIIKALFSRNVIARQSGENGSGGGVDHDA